MGAFVADRGHHGLELSVDRVGCITEFLNFLDDFLDLFLRGFRFEDDYHERTGANSTSGSAGKLEKLGGAGRARLRPSRGRRTPPYVSLRRQAPRPGGSFALYRASSGPSIRQPSLSFLEDFNDLGGLL